ncbi:MAG: SGNH/GDSL hydrolase family protein, partial [Spirochaetia bacterium]|nr:SGNH/GDSL hydrolase family protein [Spirochaetia bacterium]
MKHITLLGDSIFDNGSYVDKNKDVTTHLREIVQKNCKVSLCAVDGAMIDNVAKQLDYIPADSTSVFLSIGGNDVLQYKNVLTNNSLTALEFLTNFADVL